MDRRGPLPAAARGRSGAARLPLAARRRGRHRRAPRHVEGRYVSPPTRTACSPGRTSSTTRGTRSWPATGCATSSTATPEEVVRVARLVAAVEGLLDAPAAGGVALGQPPARARRSPGARLTRPGSGAHEFARWRRWPRAPAALRVSRRGARRSKSSCSRRVTGPGLPSPTGAPSSSDQRHDGLGGGRDERLRARRPGRRPSASARRRRAVLTGEARILVRVTPPAAVGQRRRHDHAADDREHVGGERLDTWPAGVTQMPVAASCSTAYRRPTREAAVDDAFTPASRPGRVAPPRQDHRGRRPSARSPRRSGQGVGDRRCASPPAVRNTRIRVSPVAARSRHRRRAPRARGRRAGTG